MIWPVSVEGDPSGPLCSFGRDHAPFEDTPGPANAEASRRLVPLWGGRIEPIESGRTFGRSLPKISARHSLVAEQSLPKRLRRYGRRWDGREDFWAPGTPVRGGTKKGAILELGGVEFRRPGEIVGAICAAILAWPTDLSQTAKGQNSASVTATL